jgi:hypothetical protein
VRRRSRRFICGRDSAPTSWIPTKMDGAKIKASAQSSYLSGDKRSGITDAGEQTLLGRFEGGRRLTVRTANPSSLANGSRHASS